MVERYKSSEFRKPTNKAEAVRHYLETLDEGDKDMARGLADDLLMDGPLAPVTVIIPVAAHQESHQVYHTASEYARQDTEEPFTVVMFMNSPAFPDDKNVEATLREFERAQDDFPELDLRSPGFITYADGAPIGEIRRDIWNAALLAGLEGGTITENDDILAVNHDIDLVALPRHYMSVVQNRQKDTLRMVSPSYTMVRHAILPEYPNVSKIITWNEALYSRAHMGYEAGTVIPLAFYAEHGGINPEDSSSEVINLVYRKASRTLLPTGWMLTSGRRFADKLRHGNLDELWTSTEFTHTEEYRQNDHSIEDISEERLEEIVEATTEKTMPGAVLARPSYFNRKVDNLFNGPINEALATKTLPDEEALTDQAIDMYYRHYRVNRNLLDRVMRNCIRSVHFDAESVMEIYPDDHLYALATADGTRHAKYHLDFLKSMLALKDELRPEQL